MAELRSADAAVVTPSVKVSVPHTSFGAAAPVNTAPRKLELKVLPEIVLSLEPSMTRPGTSEPLLSAMWTLFSISPSEVPSKMIPPVPSCSAVFDVTSGPDPDVPSRPDTAAVMPPLVQWLAVLPLTVVASASSMRMHELSLLVTLLLTTAPVLTMS